MLEVVPHRAVQVRTVVKRMHLMDAHAAPSSGVCLEGVDDRHRLAVG
jgi:hypothetical protein